MTPHGGRKLKLPRDSGVVAVDVRASKHLRARHVVPTVHLRLARVVETVARRDSLLTRTIAPVAPVPRDVAPAEAVEATVVEGDAETQDRLACRDLATHRVQ